MRRVAKSKVTLLIPPGCDATYEINRFLKLNGYEGVKELEPDAGLRRFEVITGKRKRKALQGLRTAVQGQD
jgi:hypothetical protein